MSTEDFDDINDLFEQRIKELRGLESISVSRNSRRPLFGVLKRLDKYETEKRLETLGLITHANKILSNKSTNSDPILSLFRETHINSHFTSLTLEGIQMIGCAFETSSFRNSDLTSARINRCDFIDVDFSRTILENADFRGSSFGLCVFHRSNLSGADMTGSRLQECDFNSTKMFGAKIDISLKDKLELTDLQRATICWVDEE